MPLSGVGSETRRTRTLYLHPQPSPPRPPLAAPSGRGFFCTSPRCGPCRRRDLYVPSVARAHCRALPRDPNNTTTRLFHGWPRPRPPGAVPCRRILLACAGHPPVRSGTGPGRGAARPKGPEVPGPWASNTSKNAEGRRGQAWSWEDATLAPSRRAARPAWPCWPCSPLACRPTTRSSSTGCLTSAGSTPEHTYVVGLQTMVLAEIGDVRDRNRIQKNVNWLLDAAATRGGQARHSGRQARRLELRSAGGPGTGPTTRTPSTPCSACGPAARPGPRSTRPVWESIREFYTSHPGRRRPGRPRPGDRRLDLPARARGKGAAR